jgi:hypothetical protein
MLLSEANTGSDLDRDGIACERHLRCLLGIAVGSVGVEHLADPVRSTS